MNNFSDQSINITKILTKKEKKDGGIFFTPKAISKELINKLMTYLDMEQKYDIMEPSCGSCEFIDELLTSGISINKIICVEKNKKIFDNILKDENIIYKNDDFLNIADMADIIIGNPPYFVMNKGDVPKEYLKYIEGRANIFILFMIHSLRLLNENGYLCFVIPTSFLNSTYYNKFREYVNDNYAIKDIIMFDNKEFIDTDQNVLGIIIQKANNINNMNNDFIIKSNGNTFFFDKITKIKLEKLMDKSTTIREMGMSVRTGTIVWNEHKNILTNDIKKKILVYNSNIVGNKFVAKEFKNGAKKQYIDIDKMQEGPIIVVNRGNGNAKYNFTYCYLDKKINDNHYLIENHLNMVIGPNDKLEQVLKSFGDPRTIEFINIFCGNNGFSKSEIESILPIYL